MPGCLFHHPEYRVRTLHFGRGNNQHCCLNFRYGFSFLVRRRSLSVSFVLCRVSSERGSSRCFLVLVMVEILGSPVLSSSLPVSPVAEAAVRVGPVAGVAVGPGVAVGVGAVGAAVGVGGGVVARVAVVEELGVGLGHGGGHKAKEDESLHGDADWMLVSLVVQKTDSESPCTLR